MYVIDAYAILELEQHVPQGVGRFETFEALTSLVCDGELVFPEGVLAECKQFARGEVATIWLVGVAGSRKRSSYPGNMPMEVLEVCEGLLAQEYPGPQSQVEVACLARARSKEGVSVIVVTEDPGLGGDRITLGEACEALGILHCGVRKMLADLGLQPVAPAGTV